jgi:hypothetical protein
MKHLKFISVITVLMIIFTANLSFVSAGDTVAENNPYVSQYIAEKNSEQMPAKKNILVDPEEEEKISISILTYYYMKIILHM